MARVEEEREFLNRFVASKSSERTAIIKNANPQQLEAIAECMLNVNSVNLTKREGRCLKQYQKIIKTFSKKKFTIGKLKAFLLKNRRLVFFVVSTILLKTLEYGILSVCNDG